MPLAPGARQLARPSLHVLIKLTLGSIDAKSKNNEIGYDSATVCTPGTTASFGPVRTSIGYGNRARDRKLLPCPKSCLHRKGLGEIRRNWCPCFPLGLIEFKNSPNEKESTWTAWNQMQTDEVELMHPFAFNSVLIVSDGIDARMGTRTAGPEWFKSWRTMDAQRLAHPSPAYAP